MMSENGSTAETDDLQLAADRVDGICAELGVSDDMAEHATEIARKADLEWPVNRSPDVVAASAVYLTGLLNNEKRTQEQISEAAGVNSMSIRKCYPELGHYEQIPGVDKDSAESGTSSSDEPGGLLARIKEVLHL